MAAMGPAKRSQGTKPDLATWKVEGSPARSPSWRGTGQEEGLLGGKISHGLWAPHEFNP